MSDLSFTAFSASLALRPTSFGIYDNDSRFQEDADKIVYFVQRNLGTPVLDAELDSRAIWSAFENAVIEYSTTINAHHARNTLLDFLGQTTGSLSGSENAYPLGNSLEFANKQGAQYSSEIGAGGPHTWFTASIPLVADQQKYDLWSALSGVLTGANANKGVTIRRVHHYENTALYRFFNQSSVLNYLSNEMGGFQSYSPETIFYLLPVWEDVLRGSHFALNQRVRRSNYSFDLKGFELTLYPVPNGSVPRVFIEYTINPKDPLTARGHQGLGVISNISNIAFGHMNYSGINDIGRTWIWKMTVAMSKEILGEIRSKYGSIPTPSGDIQLNGSELISRAREDMANLRMELKELLESMTYKNLMIERQELEDASMKELSRVPFLIYISR